MTRKIKKLLIGVAQYGSFQVINDRIEGADGLNEMEKQIALFLCFLPEGLAVFVATIVSLIVAIALLYCFISGLYRICTFHICIPGFEKWEK